MTLNFPNSAVSGQTYLGGNGVTYTFDGIKWVSAGSGGALVPISSITSGGSNITLTPDGILHLPSGGDIVDSAGNSVLAAVNQTGNYTFSGDDLEMPPRARLNSGGIDHPGAAEFGTQVSKGDYDVVSHSEVYMGSGAGEFRSIYNNDNVHQSTLTYGGVEDVNSGKFSGVVSQTPNVDSMYSIAVDPENGSIIVGAATNAGHLNSTDWATGLGTLNSGLTINGIFADTTQTVISGGAGTGSAGATFSDEGITMRTGAGEQAYSYWVDEFGNYSANTGHSYEYGFGTIHDSLGDVVVYGAVLQYDESDATTYSDTLAMKYDARGELKWRKTYRLPAGTPCGINSALAIDDQDTVYWMADSYFGTPYTFVGLNNSAGDIVSGNGSVVPVSLRFSNIDFLAIAALRSASEGNDRFMYLTGNVSGGHSSGAVVKVNVFDYSIAWARELAYDGGDVYSTQIDVNPEDGSVFTLGYALSPEKVYLNKYAANGTSVFNHVLAFASDYATDQAPQAVKYNNGHVYTSIFDAASNGSIISKWLATDCSHVWSTWVDHTAPASTKITDLGFDEAGDVICMGWTTDIVSADTPNSLYYSKLSDTNGHPVYHRVITNTNGDRFWYSPTGLRVGSVKNNLVAFATLNQSDTNGAYRINAVTIQVPADGSLVGEFDGYNIINETTEFNNRTLTAQTLATFVSGIVNTADYAGSLVTEIVEVNAVPILDTTTENRKQTLLDPAPGAVWKLGVDGSLSVPANTSIKTAYGDINITVAGQNWKFGQDGSLTTPGAIVSTAPGTVEYKSANDLDLTAANRVKITTSPLNLASFEPADFPGLAGRPGDVIFDYRSQKLRLFSQSGWGYVASTDGVGDIVLPAGGTVRNAAGVSVAYQDQLPHDLSDLTDNNQLLQQVQYAFEENIDGGGASAQYVMAMQADGGFSSTRFGSNSPVWDGDNATTTIYTETFNGGGA